MGKGERVYPWGASNNAKGSQGCLLALFNLLERSYACGEKTAALHVASQFMAKSLQAGSREMMRGKVRTYISIQRSAFSVHGRDI